MKSTDGWLVGLLRLLVPIGVLVVVALALTWRPGGPGGTDHVSANVPHAGLDFSLGVDTTLDVNQANDLCDTKPDSATPTPTVTPILAKCSIPAGTSFWLHIYLNNLGGLGYQGFDTFVTYTGLESKDNANNSDFPTCGFPASIYDAGSIRFGCGQGVGQPDSTYTGAIGRTSFNCPASEVTTGTITLNHGLSDTALDGLHAEGAGTAETLTINCTLPPTNTPTSTRSPTRTNTSPSTATFTRTPTASATPTRTATATALPSEQPDVTITKTDLQDPIGANSLLTYRLIIRNNGAQTATGVAVTDLLPSEVIFDHYVSTGASCLHTGGGPGGGFVNCTIGSMAPAAEVTIDIFVLTPTPSDDIRVGNVAVVTATNEPFANRNNNQDAEQTVILAPRADLTIEKIDKVDPVNAGGTITYNVRVENIGPGDADNVVIYDNLESGSVYNDGASSVLCNGVVPPGVDPNGVLSDVDVICNLGTVVHGAVVNLQIVIAAPSTKDDMIVKNIAFITGDNELFAQTGNNLALEDTAVIAPPPDLSIVKTGATSVRRTAYYSYKLAITNTGSGNARTVVVTDTLPKVQVFNLLLPVTLVSAVGANCNLPPNSNVITCSIPFIAGNGGSLSITLNVRAPTVVAQANVLNQVNINDADEPLDPQGNNNSSAGTKIIACFDMNQPTDNAVRINDINILVSHYGYGVGSPNYDLLYDIDGNGRILINDINILVSHFGQNC